MIRTFEYGDWFSIDKNRKTLQGYLEDIWQENNPIDEEIVPIIEDALAAKRYQGFLSFDGNCARAKNYIGFIQSDNFHVEIYPKVFIGQVADQNNTKLFLKHIFYWFDYCRKWKFPFTNTNLEAYDCNNLPELIINLIANQILTIITDNPLMLYEELQESLTVPRGRINFTRYTTNGLSNGNHHVLECDDEHQLYDNQLNRIIKYVTRQLKHKAKFSETHHKLDEILFILDEVSDEHCNSSSLTKVKLNRFFEEYNTVVNICRLILDQQIYSNNYYEQSHWSLLFPMEYVFEDFVAGFIQKELSDQWIVEYQKSDMYLTDQPNEAFKMKHDILLISKDNPELKVIVDAKYKLRFEEDQKDSKKGIAQSDMYQMTSYALRRACKYVLLLYPNKAESLKENVEYVITSGFDRNHAINIIAAEIPFWSISDFSGLASALRTVLLSALHHPHPMPPSSQR
jgi:5-methylcytosine-specific restriction enzyme subunit McrC